MAELIRGISKNARFFIADTTDIIQEAMDIHSYDSCSMEIFGKIINLAVLMGATLKNQDKLTIRTDTDGFIKNIIVNSDSSGNVKGYLLNDMDAKTLGEGSIRIIKNMGLKEAYTGMSKINYLTLANDISYYFYSSEQIPTIISFAAEFTNDGKVLCSGAYMIQLLPNSEETFIGKMEEKIRIIRPLNELLKNGMSLERIIQLLYDDVNTEDDSLIEKYEILERKEIKYFCDCNRERFYKGVLTLGKEELENIFEEEENIEVACQFCNKKYKFLKEDFSEILTK